MLSGSSIFNTYLSINCIWRQNGHSNWDRSCVSFLKQPSQHRWPHSNTTCWKQNIERIKDFGLSRVSILWIEAISVLDRWELIFKNVDAVYAGNSQALNRRNGEKWLKNSTKLEPFEAVEAFGLTSAVAAQKLPPQMLTYKCRIRRSPHCLSCNSDSESHALSDRMRLCRSQSHRSIALSLHLSLSVSVVYASARCENGQHFSRSTTAVFCISVTQ